MNSPISRDAALQSLRVAARAEEDFDFREVLGTVIAGWPLLLAVTSLVFLVGVFQAWTAPRIYRADALVQVEQDKKKSINAALGDIAELLGSEASASAEIELLKSRLLVGSVVDALNLAVAAEPVYFPLIGEAMARGFKRVRDKDSLVAPAWMGLRQYAWGGESIRVSSIQVPEDMRRSEMLLEAGDGGFVIRDAGGNELLAGSVGSKISRILPSGEEMSIFVQELVAAPGTRFRVVVRERINVVNDLIGRLVVLNKARDSGMLAVVFDDKNPQLARDIVNQLITSYQRQNVERRSAEAEQTLAFLSKQLPLLRQSVLLSEQEMNSFRLAQGSVDLDKETDLLLQRTVLLEKERFDLEQRREELIRRFTKDHPTLVTLDRQLANIRSQQASSEGKIKNLPETQQQMLRLSRDVQVNTALYMTLLNSSQELEIAKAGTVGNVRIIDYALTPIRPASPTVGVILFVSILIGGTLGLLTIFARAALHSGVDDPAIIEARLGLPTYCVVPHSPAQSQIIELLRRGTIGVDRRLLAIAEPKGVAIEALRNLRTALHFGQMDAQNNIVMITGPAPGLGKSFISANLAAVLASGGKSVVVLDCDLRRGKLHEYFGSERAPGLTDFISGTADLAGILRQTQVPGLKFIPSGTIPPNPAELLLSGRIAEIFNELSRQFDHVIIDTPPVLAVTDAALLGRYAATTMMVLKAGEHSLRMIEDTIKRLQTAGVIVRGTIVNQVGISGQGRYGYKYGYSYGYYNYRYDRDGE